MNLGETIYKLRTEKNLSQGDLAEKLEVSRQSVSKWENNSAIPDLEKIVKLSEVFEVTLDELVKGEIRLENVPKETQETSGKSEEGFPPRKIAGTILFCMAFVLTLVFLIFGGGFAGLLFAIPFIICGIICFTCRKNVGLWCAWAVFACVYIYMIYAAGIRAGNILLTLRWTAHMNYARLAIAWALFAAEMILMTVTAMKLRKTGYKEERTAKKQLLVSWVVVIGIQVVAGILPFLPFYKYIISNITSFGMIYTLISVILEWAKIIAFTVALTNTVRYLFHRKSL